MSVQGRIAAQLCQQAEAVEARHHHVGQDQVRRAPPRRRERRLAVGDGLDAVARIGEQALDVVPRMSAIVVGEQHQLAPA